MALDPALPANLPSVIREIERRLTNLERSTSLDSAAIRDGQLRVLDSDNVEKLRLGVLQDGTYGLASYDEDGNEINRVGQPPVFSFIETAEATASRTVNTWLDTTTIGPSVIVPVTSSGCVFLFYGAEHVPGTFGTTSRISYLIDGSAQSSAEAERRRTNAGNGSTVFDNTTLFRFDIIEGLTPGPHTFKLVYWFNESSGSGSPPTWRNRFLLALPQ